MGTLGRLLNTHLEELKDLYIEIKRQTLYQYNFGKLEKEKAYNIFEMNYVDPTLRIIRSIIIEKLMNNLYHFYVNEIYDGEPNPKHRGCDWTTLQDWNLMKRYAKELDLENFFISNEYNFKEDYIQEEIDAEILFDESSEIYQKELDYLMQIELYKMIKK